MDVVAEEGQSLDAGDAAVVLAGLDDEDRELRIGLG